MVEAVLKDVFTNRCEKLYELIVYSMQCAVRLLSSRICLPGWGLLPLSAGTAR